MAAWTLPSPMSARGGIVGLRAVCPVCRHVTDDGMLLDLTLLTDVQKAALEIPVGPSAWCNNVCLATWLRNGGSRAALYQALGAPPDIVSLAS